MLKTYFYPALAGIVGAIVFSMSNNHFNAPRGTGVVKLEEIIVNHLKFAADRELSGDRQEQLSTLFSQELKLAIEKVSERHRVTLFVSPAVVTGVPDYTHEVQHEITNAISNF